MKSVLAIALVTLAFFNQGCYRRECKNARNYVLKPTQQLSQYLQTNPSGETLAQNNCSPILKNVAHLPAGASTIRKLATRRYTHSRSTCVAWSTGYRRVCSSYPVYPYADLESANDSSLELATTEPELSSDKRFPRPLPRPRPFPRPIPGFGPNPGFPGYFPGYPGPVTCNWAPYSYCSAWNYDTTVEPGYREAMDLAQELDLVFANAHQTCRLASQGQAALAQAAAQDLARYLVLTAIPDSQRVYDAACTR